MVDRVIQLSGVVQTVTMADLRTASRSRIADMPRHLANQLLADAMEPLEQIGWVTLVNDHRDKKTWAINPSLAGQYLDHRLEVIKAKQRILDDSRAIVLRSNKYTPRRFARGYDPKTMDTQKYPD